MRLCCRRRTGKLAQRIAELEKELHEYKYNMGVLLIEKKSSITKYEEVSQTLLEAEEILKRKQTAHIIIISNMQNAWRSGRRIWGSRSKKS